MTETETIVNGCIDFRFADQVIQLQRENQAHLLTTAGASLNPTELLDAIRIMNPDLVINADHADCGGYKMAGDDSDLNHQRHMDQLGEKLKGINPNITHHGMILRLKPEYKGKHTCPAVAIILGQPEILKLAFERLKQKHLSGKHDIIARPLNLANHDSLLKDLKISVDLHRAEEAPFTVFIFDNNQDNAMMLAEKAAETAEGAKIETIIVSENSEEEAVA